MKILDGLTKFKVIWDSRKKCRLGYINLDKVSLYEKEHAMIDGEKCEIIGVYFSNSIQLTLLCSHDEFDYLINNNYEKIVNYWVNMRMNNYTDRYMKVMKKDIEYMMINWEICNLVVNGACYYPTEIEGIDILTMYKEGKEE